VQHLDFFGGFPVFIVCKQATEFELRLNFTLSLASHTLPRVDVRYFCGCDIFLVFYGKINIL
jgi:hypothetical protein